MDKRLRMGLNIALGLVVIAGLAVLVGQRQGWHESEQAREKAERAVGLAPASQAPAQQPPEQTPGAEPLGREDAPEMDDPAAQELAGIDLAALREVNPDAAGWIYIPGTNISHPVMQGPDNDYYLKHTWEKKWNSGGSIFLDWHSARDFEGFHTIVYGHRMNNDTMFGALEGYEDEGFWREHPYVYVADGSCVRRYEVFAAWEPRVDSLVYAHDDTPEGRQALVELCVGSSWINTGIVPGPEDKLLTLSTCTQRGNNAVRWVVQARLEQVWPAQ